MPVAVRRAVVTRAGAAEAVGSGQRSARSDRRGAEVLDVISVSPVPDGPFGQDRRYGPADERVNGVVHELGRSTRTSIHEFSTDVDDAWTTPTGIDEEAAMPSWAELEAARPELARPRAVPDSAAPRARPTNWAIVPPPMTSGPESP
jgi:hypothetical protein